MGQVFQAGVRQDSPSRSDTFVLLRVAARLGRGSRVGLYVGRQAQTLAIRLLQPAAAVQQCTIENAVRGGRHHHEPNHGTR